MAENRPVQWEYRLEEYGGAFKTAPKAEDLSTLLNELGMDGWEVVAVYSEAGTRVRIIAKRPLSAAVRRQRSMPGLDATLG
jgi:hypothetical protein